MRWLILILLLAGFFRFVGLTSAPPGLNWDEVSIGYNAYSIWQTGRDEWGEFLPLAFKAFGEVKLPGMIYASIPGIALFGTTDFGVRVTPAVIGLLGVWLVYQLGLAILASRRAALAAALLMAISPWAIHFSRVSFEANLALILSMASVLYLWRATTTPRHYLTAALFAVFAVYTYNSVRILLPLLFLAYACLGVIRFTRTHRPSLVLAICLGLGLLIPSITNLLDKSGQIRWGTVSITGQKGFYDGVAESRGYLAALPEPLPRLLQNKVTHYLFTFGQNYLQTFSTEFLVFQGSRNTQRSIQGMGMLHLFELPLFGYGLYYLCKKRDYTTLRWLLPWLLLAPIPSAITVDAPSSVRALGMLPPLLLLEGLGLSQIWSALRRYRLGQPALVAVILYGLGYLSYQLWFVNPVKYADDWLYGHREMVTYVKQNLPKVDKVYITAKYGEPYIYTLFYTAYPPARYQSEPVNRSVDPTGWVHVSGFGPFVFTDYGGLETPTEIVARQSGRILMIDGFASLPGNWSRDLTIQAPNWVVMFEGTLQNGQAK